MKSAPKPARPPKGKKRKKIGICPQCGYIWETTPDHFLHCQKELSQVVFITPPKKTKKQMYEAACDQLCRMIVEWRDGCICVLVGIDGGKCSTIPNWGHVIPQNGSAYLVYNLSNSFRQCSAHNIIHAQVNPLLYPQWYGMKFGNRAKEMLSQAQIDHRNEGLNENELFSKLVELSDLYDMRHSFGTATLEEKVEAGFYGDIIREAWIKDGRI